MIHPEVRRWFKVFKYRTQYGVRITSVNDKTVHGRAHLIPPVGYKIGNGRMHSYGMELSNHFKANKIRIWQ